MLIVTLCLSVAPGIVEHMNESGVVSSVAPEARRLAEVVGELAALPAAVDDDAARIDVIAALERLRSAVAAAQVQVIEAFATSQEAANRALGFQARAARRGVPEQVGLARRVSPAAASRQGDPGEDAGAGAAGHVGVAASRRDLRVRRHRGDQ